MTNFVTAKYNPNTNQSAAPSNSLSASQDDAVSLAQSDSYLFGANYLFGRPSIWRALVAMIRPTFLTIPEPTAPAVVTGTIRYVDPTGANGTGSLVSPFNNAVSALAVAVRGDAILFREGTTTVLTAAMIPPATSGTIPFVFGTYEPTFGQRGFLGARTATISGGGTAIDLITANNTNYVFVENLTFINNGAANWRVNFSGSSSNCVLMNCFFPAGTFHATVQGTGDNNVFDGNYSEDAADQSFTFYLGANVANSHMLRNTVVRAKDSIQILELGGPRTYSGIIAANYVADNVDPSDYRSGVYIFVNGGAPKVYENVVLRCTRGIDLTGTSATRSNFAGTIVENNICNFNEFGINVSKFVGPAKFWFNVVDNNGTKTGFGPVTANRYGRGFEFYGLAGLEGVTDVEVMYNICTNTRQWPGAAAPASEGCGIGLDNNSTRFKVYGNWCAYNEGAGIQGNSSFYCAIYGNTLIDNCNVSQAKGIEWQLNSPAAQAQISIAVCPDFQVFNNTCVSYGRPNQLFGIAAFATPDSANLRIYNNLLLAQKTAGVYYVPGTSIESTNRVIGSPVSMNAATSELFIPGAGSTQVSINDVVVQSGFVVPQAGKSCDNTGQLISSGIRLMGNLPANYRRPIGATPFPATMQELPSNVF